ncbi:MAG TPA: class F sortase [Bacillales bacterium]
MKKWMMMLIGACLLVAAAGCSQTTQASRDKSGQQTEESQQMTDTKSKDNGSAKMNDSKNNQKEASKNEKSNVEPSPIDTFDWGSFSKGQKKKQGQNKTDQNNESEQGVIPVKIKIPAINVKTEVIKKGLVKEGKYKGHMATPDNAVQTAWFKLGPKPGEKGAAIIAGHVDTTKGPGVFFNLEDLQEGDLVYITGKDGKKLTFKVFKKKAYPRKDVPLRKVFGYTPAKVVELITCTGDFIESEGTHNKRLVVSAVLMEKDQVERPKS